MGIVRQFAWPRAVYTDNGAHLVSGEFAKVLCKLSVIHLPAAKSHTQSVGLAERYVKLLVDGLKVTVMQQKLRQGDWDLVVDSVVHAINSGVLRVHGFSPAEVLLGFNPNRTGWDVNSNTERAVAALSTLVASGTNAWKGEGEEEEEERLADQQLERLAPIDHIRQQAVSGVVEEA